MPLPGGVPAATLHPRQGPPLRNTTTYPQLPAHKAAGPATSDHGVLLREQRMAASMQVKDKSHQSYVQCLARSASDGSCALHLMAVHTRPEPPPSDGG